MKNLNGDMSTELSLTTEGEIGYVREQDETPYLEANKYEYNNNSGAKTRFGRKVASIPNIVIEQWMQEGINIFDMKKDPAIRKEVFKKLNSNEFRYLRTHNSKL